MTRKGIETEIRKQLFETLEKVEKLTETVTELKSEMKQQKKEFQKEEKAYKKEIENLKFQLKKKDAENEELKAEILRLRKNNQKDSSNSSKPSSTNGYKKVITNTRPKSKNAKGKPKGSPSTNLSKEKLETFLKSGNVKYVVEEINKTKKNKNQRCLTFKVLDIEVQKVYKEVRVYPNEDGTYDIPAYATRPIQYGNNLKAICTFLNNDIYNSTDGITRFISYITNGGVNLSKSTILSWNKKLSENLQEEIAKIEETLQNSYYINGDDSTIKIDGDSYYDLCICNDTHTRLYISDKKDSDAWKQKTILGSYKGIIVKDGTDVFNGMGIALAQCVSHIQRYLKGVYDFVNHQGPVKMDNFLKKCIHTRKSLIKQGKKAFCSSEKEKLMIEFIGIFREWKKEWMYSKPSENAVYDDERKLLARFEDEKEKEQILYFIDDFNVPTTNSQAEVDQRGLKIKQKIGKFRCTDCADEYAIIRSCILTYKKNDINVMEAIKSAFENNPVII